MEDPTLLQRLKFHTEEQQGLHDGGIHSARGRLEGGPDAGPGAGPAGGGEGAGQSGGGAELGAAPPSGLPAPGLDKKRHTIAVPGSDFGSPKWGASEVRMGLS